MKSPNLTYIRKLLAGQIEHHTRRLADARDELDYAQAVAEIAAAAAALADITATANEPKPVPAFEPVQRFFDRAVANASHLRDLEVYLGTSPIANGAAHNLVRDFARIAERPADYLSPDQRRARGVSRVVDEISGSFGKRDVTLRADVAKAVLDGDKLPAN